MRIATTEATAQAIVACPEGKDSYRLVNPWKMVWPFGLLRPLAAEDRLEDRRQQAGEDGGLDGVPPRVPHSASFFVIRPPASSPPAIAQA